MILFINRLLGSNRILLLALTLCIVIILYVGLKDNIRGENQVSVSNNNHALMFGNYSIAYAINPINFLQTSSLNQSGYEIKLDLSPTNYESNSFQFILLISNGIVEDQLIVAQWRDYIIVMNGDDYNYRRKSPRLTSRILNHNRQFHRLILRVDDEAVSLSLDNQKTVRRRGQWLKLPFAGEDLTFVFSTSELLDNNWKGSLKAFSLTDLAQNSAPLLAFGNSLTADSAQKIEIPQWLVIPKDLKILKRQILEKASFTINSKNTLYDILLNTFGFIPFGFLVCFILLNIKQQDRAVVRFTKSLFFAGAFAFFLSLFIEYSQSWLITRHSSLRDLYLNTLGGAVGGGLAIVVYSVFAWIKNHRAH